VDASIRSFQFHATDEQLNDLRRRLAATKWPSRELVTDASQGVQLATVKELARYWQSTYDWRRFERRLNSLPQFVTTIDGVDIHFIHVRSKHTKSLPIIITHGWPGSIIEQLKVIDPLTNPTAYGGTAADAFDVVIPSLPGHGFSGTPTSLGWDPVRIARAWIVLMQRLGYTNYVAQGGDWGNAVTEQMALEAPPGLIGIHTNMPATIPDDIAHALQSNGPSPPGLSADEQYAYGQLDFFYKHGLAYAQEMSNRPQTLYAVEDSPVGLAAWMLDHDARSYELIARVFAGKSEGLTRDDVLDKITLYWLTNTGVSSARLYWESKLPFFAPKGVTIPVAVSAYPSQLPDAAMIFTRHVSAAGLEWDPVETRCHPVRLGTTTVTVNAKRLSVTQGAMAERWQSAVRECHVPLPDVAALVLHAKWRHRPPAPAATGSVRVHTMVQYSRRDESVVI
jgi:pimeloyl-ACP methyl ester carboxylesterase